LLLVLQRFSIIKNIILGTKTESTACTARARSNWGTDGCLKCTIFCGGWKRGKTYGDPIERLLCKSLWPFRVDWWVWCWWH